MPASNHPELANSLALLSAYCSSALSGKTESESAEILFRDSSSLHDHLTKVHRNEGDGLLAACVSALLSDHIMSVLVPHFNRSMAEEDTSQGMTWFTDAVADIHTKLSAIHHLVERLTSLCPDLGRKTWRDAFQLAASLLVDQAAEDFRQRTKSFYGQALRAYSALHPVSKEDLICGEEDNEMDEEDEDEDDEEVDVMTEDEAELFMTSLSRLTPLLVELSWLSTLVGDVMYDLVQGKIDLFLQGYKEKYYRSALLTTLKFCDILVLPWMQLVAPHEVLRSPDGKEEVTSELVYSQWKAKLRVIVCDRLLHLRIKEMFNIVVYYPESSPVIDEMKTCCQSVDKKPLLVESLRQALIDRLLQPGADTRDIISQYASLVKALRQFDPTGVIMEQVCHPVRLYLRCREDCGRCIVETLLTEESGELADEFERGVKIKSFEDDDYETMLETWDTWEPEPVDVCLENTAASRTKTDVIGLLITIYGSREQFLAQYQSLLAARLLRSLTYDNMQELGNLERVKVCFNDADMSRCDVMLADITGSRRVDKAIHEAIADQSDVDTQLQQPEVLSSCDLHTFTLSRAYWESRLPQDTQLAKLQPPPEVQRVMDDYGKEYSRLKNDRRLEWCHNLGQVELDLQFPSSSVSFSCNPLQASLISLFQGIRTSWSVGDLSTELSVSEKTLRPALLFWLNEHILSEERAGSAVADLSTTHLSGQDVTYHIISDTSELMSADVSDKMVLPSQDQGAGGDSALTERVETFWPYVEGMLTNFGELPLDRIHSMISLYADDQMSENELRAVLDVKLKEQEVLISGGIYSLPG